MALPKYKSLDQDVQRQTERVITAMTLKDSVFPSELNWTYRKDRVLADEYRFDDEENLLNVSTERNLNLVERIQQKQADRTCKICTIAFTNC